MDTKAQGALAIIELYKLRCEPLMRSARAWFISEFAPQSGRQIVELMLSGLEESAYYRMVASYWDSTASLVNNGGIDEKLFLEANTEHVVVFAKLQPFIDEIRQTIGEPDYLEHLERLVLRVPNIEKKLENRRKLLKSWARARAGTQTAVGSRQ
ncbi:MAG: hypothetical protein ND866_08740 [Pyrinomonadaceae bacterium]|nr:hypothetical protein [Pyrinomonadaceae bacterium]